MEVQILEFSNILLKEMLHYQPNVLIGYSVIQFVAGIVQSAQLQIRRIVTTPQPVMLYM